jgi:hypothetical protein
MLSGFGREQSDSCDLRGFSAPPCEGFQGLPCKR